MSSKFQQDITCSWPELRLVDKIQLNIVRERLNQQDISCQQGMVVRPIGQNQQDSSNQLCTMLVLPKALDCNNTNLHRTGYNLRLRIYQRRAGKFQLGKGKV